MSRHVPMLRRAALALLTPLLGKNVLKTASLDVPMVFSMSRVVVLSFAVAMLRQVWKAGIAGWPAGVQYPRLLLVITLGLASIIPPQ